MVATAATFTPTSRAPCGLTALARIARPVQVRVRNSHRPTSTPIATRQPYTCAFGKNSSPARKDWLKYGGGVAGDVVAPTTPLPPSSTSAGEKDRGTDDAAGASRMRRIAPP